MIKYPFVKQTSYKDCGATSLLMIIKYYKGYIPLEKLYEMTSTNKNGTSAYHILKAAETIGFKGYGMKCDIDHIKEDNIILPAIAHVIIDETYPHFVVIYKIDYKKRKILIADPADRLKIMTFEEFKKIFTNKIIILYPIRKIPKEQVLIKKTIYNIFSSHKKSIIITYLLMNLSLIISLISLYNLTNLLQSNQNIFKNIIIIFLLMTIKLLINIFKDKMMIKTNYCITSNLTNETYKNILLLPYQYYRDHTTGDVMTRMNDLNEIRDFVTAFILLFNDLLFILVSGILLYIISSKLFFIVFLTTILYIFYYLLFNRKLIKQLEYIKRERENLNSYMTESVLGFESIKGLNLENNFIKTFKDKNNSFLEHLKKYQNQNIKLDNIKDYFSDLNLLIIISFGLYLIHQNVLNFKELILFYMLLSYFIDPIKNILELDFMIQNIKLSLTRILELKGLNKYSKQKENGILEWIQSNITINDKLLLKNINFKIYPRDKIMIFGKSGSGKSTILKIMKQYYKSNNLYVNNKDYNNLDFKNKIVYISQEEYLFTGTLYSNIVLNRKIDSEILNKIVKICLIDEIINKNELGIHMLIEENGFNLSGGEKQRIVLARALVSNFDYLFIDEGLSQIDINSERKILKNLLQHYHNKTIVFVSHRLDNLDLFNKALKVDQDVEVLEKNKGGVLCFEK